MERNKFYGDNSWIDLIGTGGLRKKIIREGKPDSKPVQGDEVVVSILGRLENGREVEKINHLAFTLGGGEVLSGFDLAVATMDKHEISEVYMEPRFCYRDLGLPPHIPPNSALFYTIELIKVTEEQEPENLDIEVRAEIGNRKKERGNWWFNREDYRQAIQCYKSAIDFFDDVSDPYGEFTSSEVKSIFEKRLKTLNNMAAAQMKIEAYDAALISLEPVLKCDPTNLKALFRKGKVLSLQGKHKEAYEVYVTAQGVDPYSKKIAYEVARSRDAVKRQIENEKSLYRRMFGLNNSSSQDRHPTVRSKYFQVWLISFVILFSTGLLLKHIAGYF